MNHYLQDMLVADRQRRHMQEAERHRLVAQARRAAEPGDRRARGFVNQIWAAVRPAGTLQRSALPTGKRRLRGGPTIVAASSTAIGS
jgi:hypothetical protein